MMAPGNKVHFLPHFSVRTSSSGRATDADRDACTVPGAAAAAALPHSSFSSSPLVLPQTQLAPYSKGTWPYTGSHLCDKVSDVTQGTCFGSQFVVSSLGWTASWFKVPEKKGKSGMMKQSSPFMETRRLGTRRTLAAHALSDPPPPPGGPPTSSHQISTPLTGHPAHSLEAQSTATPVAHSLREHSRLKSQETK